MGKKGVSAILATIIIIFIMMTLVLVVVAFSNNFFKKQKDDSTTISPQYMKLKATIDSVVIGPDEKTVTIIITRTDNEGDKIPLKGVRFKFSNINGDSYTYDKSDPPTDASMPKSYTITNTDLGIDSFSGINKVSLSGISPEEKQTQILDERAI